MKLDNVEIHGSIIRKCDNCGKESIVYCLNYRGKHEKLCRKCLKENYNIFMYNTFDRKNYAYCPKCKNISMKKYIDYKKRDKGCLYKFTQYICTKCSNIIDNRGDRFG